MLITERTIAVGVFHDPEKADRTYKDLVGAGFPAEKIGVMAHHLNMRPQVKAPAEKVSLPGTVVGIVGGGIFGGGVGAFVASILPGLGIVLAGGSLASALGGMAIGIVAGGFAGSLLNTEVSEQEVYYYQDQQRHGRVIISVNVPARFAEASAILREHGAMDTSGRVEQSASAVPHIGFATGAILPIVPPLVMPPDAYTNGMIDPGLDDTDEDEEPTMKYERVVVTNNVREEERVGVDSR
ncbi:MAG TPA: hypothetical protein VL461_07360 [Dictyobacter sp.]|jgi:hypothetical protein|nr:hypothetical protein [Dictyobacter sp.]